MFFPKACQSLCCAELSIFYSLLPPPERLPNPSRRHSLLRRPPSSVALPPPRPAAPPTPLRRLPPPGRLPNTSRRHSLLGRPPPAAAALPPRRRRHSLLRRPPSFAALPSRLRALPPRRRRPTVPPSPPPSVHRPPAHTSATPPSSPAAPIPPSQTPPPSSPPFAECVDSSAALVDPAAADFAESGYSAAAPAMDAGAFAGDVPADRRRVTLFGGNSPTNCLPGLSRAHFATLGEEEEEGCSVDERRGGRGRRRREDAHSGARALIRHSALYSDRRKRSRGRRGQVKAEKDASEVSSSELGTTTTDMPKFKTLSLNDSPSAPDSIGREPGHAEAGSKTHIRQSSLYSQRKRQPRRKRREADSLTLPVKERADDVRSSDLDPTNKDLSKVDELLLDDEPYIPGLTHSKGSVGPDSTFAKPSAHKEASPSLSKWLQELEDYAREHTINSLEEFFEYMRPPQGYPSPETKVVEDEAMTDQQSSQERSILAPEHAQLDPAQGQYADDSDKEIAQNGMKWMSEEAMVAFQKYIAETDDLKGYDYRFDELLLQCFTVEHYYKIFHHFNFTVKMKVASATEWTSKLYFAEVHEMLGEKIYFCSPLEPDENGNCFACKNQGMDDLKHPIVGVFDRGSPDLSFPYTYSSGSDDEAWL